MKKLFCAALLLLLPVCFVRAWNAQGHMVVAQMAYSHLQPDVKARCDTLIAVVLPNASIGTSNFITAAVWADDFRTTLGTGNWHYIDIPFGLNGVTNFSGVPDESFDVVRAINLCVATLQSTTSSETDKATCLRYLLHFIGDIEQPLHCSTAVDTNQLGGDAGGNGFALASGNLHSLWDSGGGISESITRPLNNTGRTILSNKVNTVEALYPYNYTTNLNLIADPMTWAVEGWQLAQTVCYVGITRNGTPSNSYLNSVTNTTRQRLAAGGHRLADLLNTIFTTNAVTLKAVGVTNGNFVFYWNALTNRTYAVEWKSDLTNASWNVLSNITTSGNQPFYIRESVGQPRRFYRVNQ